MMSRGHGIAECLNCKFGANVALGNLRSAEPTMNFRMVAERRTGRVQVELPFG